MKAYIEVSVKSRNGQERIKSDTGNSTRLASRNTT
jgi:hypothetical protein